MPKKAPISYDDVAQACLEISQAGHKPSVRAVHKHIGGSFSTLSEYLQRYEEQRRLSQQTDAKLSDTFRQALLAEFGRVTESAKQELLDELTSKSQQLKEAQQLLVEYEQTIDCLQQDLLTCQKNNRQQELRFEKLITGLETRLKESEKQFVDKAHTTEQLQQQLHQSDIKAAVNETQATEYAKHIERLEQELSVLRK